MSHICLLYFISCMFFVKNVKLMQNLQKNLLTGTNKYIIPII